MVGVARDRLGPRRWLLAVAVVSMVASVAVSAVVSTVTPALATPSAGPPIAPPTATPTPADVIGGAQLAAAGTVVDPTAPPLPTVSAAGWLVADLDTGEVLAAHDAHGRYAPASTLKILTALVVIPRLAPTAAVLATQTDAAVDGTRVGIVPGHRYTVATLLQGMLMVSGNDAALALASAAGGAGGAPATINAMNAEAASLQADDTVAKTVDGLDAAGQSSSAYDLALLARAALQLPSFRTDVGTERVEFAGTGVPPFQIANHNPLLGAVPGVYGVKNGYTDAARASYVGAARRDGHDIVVVVMRSVPDFVPESKALFDWGFAADGHVDPVGTLVGPVSDRASDDRAAAAAVSDATLTTAARHHARGYASAAWLTVGVVAGTLVLLILARREQIKRRRRARARQRRLNRSW